MVHGEAIYTARLAAGLTQAKLAERTGMTQAALSRYENDLREPDGETVERIAAELGVTGQLLSNASGLLGATAVDAHMRRRATAKATVWRRLEARLNILRLQVHQLSQSLDLDAVNHMPRLDPIEYSPDAAARLVRMQWRMPVGPVRGVVAWMESAGCFIVEMDFGTPRIDGMSQWIDDHPIVLINSRVPTDRLRLTLAHELGHLVLHSDPEHVTDEVESEAFAFAAEFLMPAVVIRPQLRALSVGRLHDLKREWMVSFAALIERSYDLGLMTPTRRTSMYKMLSKRGWRTREPLSDVLPLEEPSLPRASVEALMNRGYTADEIATLGGFSGVESANEVIPLMSHLRVVT
jgi:Zn-dependent peptidase ImmA (M78 family)/DNA-binding XRE family transcriptional regulator